MKQFSSAVDAENSKLLQLEETIKLEDQARHQMLASHEKQLQNMKEKQEAVKDNHVKEIAELESELILLKTTVSIPALLSKVQKNYISYQTSTKEISLLLELAFYYVQD